MITGDLKALPYPREQVVFSLLLTLLFGSSVWMAILCFWPTPPIGKLYSAATWAGTAAGLSVTAALLQTNSKEFMDSVLDEFSNEIDYPHGPPSIVMRSLMAFADKPVLRFIINLSYSQAVARILAYWAGITCIISYWAP